MVKGIESKKSIFNMQELPDIKWSLEQHMAIIRSLTHYGCRYLKSRDEYTLLKEVVSPDVTQVSNSGNKQGGKNPAISRPERSGVKLPLCSAIEVNDTDTDLYSKPFMAPLDIQKVRSIADGIPSFKVIQSNRMSLNIGFDTESQVYTDGFNINRFVLSLQMTIAVGDVLIRYFFLVCPSYQEVTAEGGRIPLKLCLADILDDLKKCYFNNFPLVLKKSILYKDNPRKDHVPLKVIDYAAMRDSVIPITLICHTGKADISVFRRSKYDTDIIRKLGEIQGGWMTTEYVYFTATNDKYRNYYWLINLSVRDTLGLTPAENKSLKALGNVIHKPKIELPTGVIKHMAAFAVSNPVEFYKYAMNDADIVVSFCAELFRCNHAVPITLSSAAASAMYASIKEYLGVNNKADYDRIYRGLEMLDEGILPSKNLVLRLKYSVDSFAEFLKKMVDLRGALLMPLQDWFRIVFVLKKFIKILRLSRKA